jgi:hypothetical protein
MRRIVFLLVASVFMVGAAGAADITLTFNNKSGQALTAISATPKTGGTAQSLLAAALAANSKVAVTFTPPAGACVFNVVYTLANGKGVTMNDTDLCLMDQIVVE